MTHVPFNNFNDHNIGTLPFYLLPVGMDFANHVYLAKIIRCRVQEIIAGNG